MADPLPEYPIAASVWIFGDLIEKATGERPRSVALPRATYDALVDEAKGFCNLRAMSKILGADPTEIRISGVLCVLAEGE